METAEFVLNTLDIRCNDKGKDRNFQGAAEISCIMEMVIKDQDYLLR